MHTFKRLFLHLYSLPHIIVTSSQDFYMRKFMDIKKIMLMKWFTLIKNSKWILPEKKKEEDTPVECNTSKWQRLNTGGNGKRGCKILYTGEFSKIIMLNWFNFGTSPSMGWRLKKKKKKMACYEIPYLFLWSLFLVKIPTRFQSMIQTEEKFWMRRWFVYNTWI